MGILMSRNPNKPEGLEGWLSVGIHRIPTKLLHSIERELRKLHRTRTDSGRASTLELLRGLPTSREVLRSSESRLSLYSKNIEFGSPLGVAKPHFLHIFCRGDRRHIYRSKVVLRPKIGRVRPSCQAGRPCNMAGLPCLVAPPPFPHWILILPT
jgi:hypothetical protein